MISLLKYIKATQLMLGKNERNLLYTLPENPRKARAIADNKLKAKKVFTENDIPVPATYAVIKSQEALDRFDWNRLPASFVLKPNKGFGGQGILIVYGEKKRKIQSEERRWIKADGSIVSINELKAHIGNILEGSFSLKNVSDTAFFEQRVVNIPMLKQYLYKGVPSIRIISYNNIPIMADIKLPTKASQGKANLHAGGVLVGIDIATGVTTNAIQYDALIEVHPDTKMRLSGIQIPYWDKILEMAIKSQIATGLGYIGVDIAIDKELGPVILEINARPGLGTQIANNDSIKERLLRVKKLKVKTVKKGIRIAKELFGGEIEEEVETMLGKKMLGLYTRVTLTGKNDINATVEAKIDTGADLTSIDRELAIHLGFQHAIEYFETFHVTKALSREEAQAFYDEKRDQILHTHPDIADIKMINSSTGSTIRMLIPVTIEIEGVIKETKATVIDRKNLLYQCIVGSRDLKNFIIDVTKKS